jgi:hypothetical protein
MFVARNPFNVASDWVGSCVIIIKKQRERGEMPEMNFLTLRVQEVVISKEVVEGTAHPLYIHPARVGDARHRNESLAVLHVWKLASSWRRDSAILVMKACAYRKPNPSGHSARIG